MKILIFDTCNAILSVAILKDREVIYSEIDNEPSKQAERLISLIDRSLKSTALKLREFDYIAVSNGPGSFTGVRIGLSTAMGINIATNIPIIAISCLEALAYKYTELCPRILVAMDARGSKLYVQNFNNYLPIDEPQLLSYDEAIEKAPSEKFVIVGEGAKYFKEIVPHGTFSPIIDSEMVGHAAYIKLTRNLKMNDVAPLYIKEANIGI